MKTKAKTFDCVEMKRECQRKLREEYELRKGEFDSYADFIRKTAEESGFVREMRQRFGRAGATRTDLADQTRGAKRT